ncbi:hypothetical protein KM043_000770 [Ampulex compressa]|nr:hypothetical protein KM043_000770 [Ampulex compressa]
MRCSSPPCSFYPGVFRRLENLRPTFYAWRNADDTKQGIAVLLSYNLLRPYRRAANFAGTLDIRSLVQIAMLRRRICQRFETRKRATTVENDRKVKVIDEPEAERLVSSRNEERRSKDERAAKQRITRKAFRRLVRNIRRFNDELAQFRVSRWWNYQGEFRIRVASRSADGVYYLLARGFASSSPSLGKKLGRENDTFLVPSRLSEPCHFPASSHGLCPKSSGASFGSYSRVCPRWSAGVSSGLSSRLPEGKDRGGGVGKSLGTWRVKNTSRGRSPPAPSAATARRQ